MAGRGSHHPVRLAPHRPALERWRAVLGRRAGVALRPQEPDAPEDRDPQRRGQRRRAAEAVRAEAAMLPGRTLKRRSPMRRTLSLFALASGLVASLLAAQPAPQHFDGQTWWSHVKVLADDNMEGR